MVKEGKDLKDLEPFDVCVVGAGAAGVTTAWYLQAAGFNVVLADAGREGPGIGGLGTQVDMVSKRIFYSGETSGQFDRVAAYNISEPYNNCTGEQEVNVGSFLTRPWQGYQSGPWERERTFGGTTAHFGGQSRPLDPITYDGIPNGVPLRYPSWPISYQELEPYISQATDFLRLCDTFDASDYAVAAGGDVPDLPNFNAEIYQFLAANDNRAYGDKNFAYRKFGQEGQTITESRATVVRNATLAKMEVEGGRIKTMHFANLQGGENPGECPSEHYRFTINAKHYVLALGAVENARQMLLSEMTNPNIGKYFMCHPYTQSTAISLSQEFLPQNQQWADGRIIRGQVGNCTTQFSNRFIINAETAEKHNIGRMWLYGGLTQGVYLEMTPNEQSRITLSDKTESVLGQRLTNIHWELTEDDQRTYEENAALFAAAVKQMNPNVSVNIQPWEAISDTLAINGHHLGTTRMSNSATDGVVDANLRSHDVENLFVAGSSVWTNAGISNPTFTIVMLAIRLAEYLGGELKK